MGLNTDTFVFMEMMEIQDTFTFLKELNELTESELFLYFYI